VGLVGATAVLATVTGLWLARSGKKERLFVTVQNIGEAKKEANVVDREINCNQSLSSTQKQQAHNNNIIEIAKARVHFEKCQNSIYSFALAHKPFCRISPWNFLKKLFV